MSNLSIPSEIDILIIASKNDIKLLRHFFLSQTIFSKLGGKTHLFIWRSEQYLLDKINLPCDVILHFKDEIPGLVSNDFRNQMYIKLIADRFIKSEWFWIADADYLICDYLHPKNFFNDDGKPYWFYRAWDGGPPEERWREGCEKFIGRCVPFLFLDEPQFLMNTKILPEFRKNYDVKGLLYQAPMPADCLVYGDFAFDKFNDLYEWVDIEGSEGHLAISYKVNQRPPSYCALDPCVKLSELPAAKYYIFWSYWELSEQKMKEFLLEAVQIKAPNKLIQFEECELDIQIPIETILLGDMNGFEGLYSDGWAHRRVSFIFYNENYLALRVALESLDRQIDTLDTSIQIILNGEELCYRTLNSGINEINVSILPHQNNHIVMKFQNGVLENNGMRELYARIISFRLIIDDYEKII